MRRELLVEMEIGGQWRDVTAAEHVYTRDPVTITRGRADEAGQASPSMCSLTLNNRDGRYSPRNPLGPYYGQFGRNTPIRVGITTDVSYDAYSAAQGTGDLSWTHTPTGSPTGVAVFVWQYNTNAGQVASVTYGGRPMERKTFGLFLMGGVTAVGYLYWLNREIPAGPQTVVVDTTATAMRQASCITVTGGSRAELEANPFGYSNAAPSANPTLNLGSFTRPVMLFGSLLSELDDPSSIAPGFGYGQLAEHDLGTETVAVERSNSLNVGPSYFASWSAPSAHWGIMVAAVRAVHYRFWGEVASLPPKWDLSGKDAYVPIEAAGTLRRLGQGKEPAQTGLRAFLEAQDGLARYWPLSGAKGTTYSLDVAPVWGVSTTGVKFFSEAPPTNYLYGEEMGSDFLGNGMAFFNSDGGAMRGDVAMLATSVALDFVFRTDEMGSFTARIFDYGGANWGLSFDPSGILQVSFDDGILGPIGFSPAGPVPELLDGVPHHCRFELLKNGTATDFAVYIDGELIDTGSMSGKVLNNVAVFRLYLSRTGTQSYMVLSHIAVWALGLPSTWPTAAEVTEAARGYAGETAGERVARVLGLAGVALTTIGDPDDTQLMGPQYAEPMLSQVRDAEATDSGIFAEPRDAGGVLYRTGRSLYNQPATVTLDYGHIVAPFEPVDDDQATRNDVTMSRRDGGNYRVQQTSGRLSIQPPPLGVGRYPDDASVNCVDDDAIPPYAQWALHMGTLDAARFPSIPVNLAAPGVDDATAAAVLAVDLGDRIEVQNAEAANIYEPISLVVFGYTETISAAEHLWSANCSPGELFEVIELDDATSRIGVGDVAELVATVNSSATALSVLSSDGVTLWTTDPAQFPFDVELGGERMTVTAVAGTVAGVAQTFTVTRAVNGVAKGHAAGTVLQLARRAVWAL